jgi:hypothetical protein
MSLMQNGANDALITKLNNKYTKLINMLQIMLTFHYKDLLLYKKKPV